jgi:methionyl aminopeptidase
MSRDAKILAMREGGRALGKIKAQLRQIALPEVSFEEIEKKAQTLIAAAGMLPSFSTVPNYKWATCIMKNDQLCHGIPQGQLVKAGDLITIDVGLINQGFHLDTTISFAVEPVTEEVRQFLNRGQALLDKAIGAVKPGGSVYDISYQMDKGLSKFGYGAVFQLTGHGIGSRLHMEPEVPVVARRSDKRKKLSTGDTIAVEIMYAMGDPRVTESSDGWTFVTEDGSLSAMFEETVLVTSTGYEVLTKTS